MALLKNFKIFVYLKVILIKDKGILIVPLSSSFFSLKIGLSDEEII